MVKSERVEALMRLVVLVVSGIILYAWSYLSYVLIVVNWLATLVIGRRIKEIADFIELWNTQVYYLSRYISGVSNVRPFPFGEKLNRISKFEKNLVSK